VCLQWQDEDEDDDGKNNESGSTSMKNKGQLFFRGLSYKNVRNLDTFYCWD